MSFIRKSLFAILLSAVASIAVAAPTPDLEVVAAFDIQPQQLTSALVEFSRQANTPVVSATRDVDRFRTSGISGKMSLREALRALLAGTNLDCRLTESGAIAVGVFTAASSANSSPIPLTIAQVSTASGNEVRKAAVEAPGKQTSGDDDGQRGIPEVLVQGSRLLNMDIRRTRDDTQPYVIFDRSTLESSGAANLEAFLRDRLTANASAAPKNQAQITGFAHQSEINLRGLGAGQTLVLIDGRRISGVNNFGTPAQGDIRSIPMSAVERIEVLPTTASGIYGGSATGGVINIILRRDYSGAELKLSLDNSFDSDTTNRRVDLATGFGLEEGRTQVLLAGSFADSNGLAFADRNFIQRGRATILANRGNNYQAFDTGAFPILGATPNIRSADNSSLVLKNGTALNSPITFVPEGYAGPTTDDGVALVANAGRYNLGLANSNQIFGGRGGSMMWAPEVRSAMVTLRREFTPRIQAFIDGAYTDTFTFKSLTTPISNTRSRGAFTLPVSSPSNPFRQIINVEVPSDSVDDESTSWSNNRDRRLTGGIIVQLPRKWQGEIDYAWGESLFHFGVGLSVLAPELNAATASGAVNIMRDIRLYPVDFSQYLTPPTNSGRMRTNQKDVTARFSGPVATLPAGPVVVSTLMEHRDEIFGDGNQGDIAIPSRSQSVASVYLETRVPLVSASNARPGVRELEVQLAGRHDRYETNGVTSFILTPTDPIFRNSTEVNSTNPTVGLRYQPLQAVVLRASYGTGFLPPAVNQVLPVLTSVAAFTDPRRGNESVSLPQGAVLSGGNPNLKPEESESFSAGLIFTPRLLQGLRLSVDYTKIEKTDNIATFPGGNQALVNNENLFPGRIQRAAPASGDPFGVGRIVGLDITLFNIARANLEAYDLQLDYTQDTADFGAFNVFALATRQTHYRTQVLVTQPVIENVGVTSSNPLKFKANAGLNWTLRNLTMGWVARYFDSYRLADAVQLLNQGGAEIPSQTYHDLFVQYGFGSSRAGWMKILADTEIQFGINNVFDTVPPFDASNTQNGFYSLYGDPRLRTWSISLRKNL